MRTNCHSPQSGGGAFVRLDWGFKPNPAKQALSNLSSFRGPPHSSPYREVRHLGLTVETTTLSMLDTGWNLALCRDVAVPLTSNNSLRNVLQPLQVVPGLIQPVCSSP